MYFWVSLFFSFSSILLLSDSVKCLQVGLCAFERIFLFAFYSTGNLTYSLYPFELMFPIFTLLIFVPSGDSSGISVTGETPQERGFRDEEAHRTPHGKRPLVTKISADQDVISPTSYIIQPLFLLTIFL
ncbi:hypothetical protein C7437_10786 [Psychrobacillus insolitus]|uniref:Uncharacterized protein n=1 Tax=Psychrobacillus insolitus TaxID=1461 RepID=A0A2W7MZH3_9BACI|nr:hypothetical protein C7437_10786 [Psychrobacillus insolitus]